MQWWETVEGKAWLENQPDLENKFIESTSNYCSMGARFSVGSNKLIVAQVGYMKVCLIDLESGNRWLEPIFVRNPCKITLSEFKQMTVESGETFGNFVKLKENDEI